MRFIRGLGGRLAMVCLAINLAVLLGIAVRNSEYLGDFRLSDSPDAQHYVQLGRNLLLDGRYSRTEGPSYPPDFMRTPVYPIVAGALEILGGVRAIYVAHALLQVAMVLLLFRTARVYFGETTAFWVGLLAATDLLSAVHNFNALTEPLYTFLTLLAVLMALRRWVPPPEDPPPPGDARSYLVIGTLLALATLTRPSGLYVPVILAVVGLWFVGRRAGSRGALRAATLVLIPSVVLVGAWIVRNQLQFGVAKVTGLGPVGFVYVTGAGAYQVRHDLPRFDAQQMIAEEFELPTALEAQNPWSTPLSEREIGEKLSAAAPQVLRKYPVALVQSSLIGLVKANVSHNVHRLASLHSRGWTAPGSGGLLRFEGEAFARLFSNHPALIGAFVWQIFHALSVLALGALGLLYLARSPSGRDFALPVLAVFGYMALTIALFGVDAYYRSRIPLLPYLFLFAGYGASAWRARRA